MKFLFVPGLPRCATTSLVQILGQHPDIFLPKIKEPHFFLKNRDAYYMFNRRGERIPFSKSGFINSRNEFDGNYANFKTGNVFIDGSTLYSVHPDSMEEIALNKNIDPYFIILKRDPFKRALSHYLYSVSRGEEYREFSEALDDEMNNRFPFWLLGGYLAGSDSSSCEEKINQLWQNNKTITANIETDKIFDQEFMDQVLRLLHLPPFSFNLKMQANSLVYTDKRIVSEIRIFAKKIRQLNPRLIDNKLTRALFSRFMTSIPSDTADIYDQYEKYRPMYMELFNLKKGA